VRFSLRNDLALLRDESKRRARRREPASSRLLRQDQCRPPNAQIRTRIGIGTPSSHSNMYRPISHLLSVLMEDKMHSGASGSALRCHRPVQPGDPVFQRQQ
jgi:hypothetical protein